MEYFLIAHGIVSVILLLIFTTELTVTDTYYNYSDVIGISFAFVLWLPILLLYILFGRD